MKRAWLSLIFLTGCASQPGNFSQYHLTLDEDAYLSWQGQMPSLLNAGETVEIKRDSFPVWVHIPGKGGWYLMQPRPLSSDLKLSVAEGRAQWQEITDRELAKRTDFIVQELLMVQKLMAAKRTDEAMARIEALERDYPKLESVRGLKASCLLVQGERSKAEALMNSSAEKREISQEAQTDETEAEETSASPIEGQVKYSPPVLSQPLKTETTEAPAH